LKKTRPCRLEFVAVIVVEACAVFAFFHDGQPFMVAGVGFIEFDFAHFVCMVHTPGFEVDGFRFVRCWSCDRFL